MDCLIRGFTGLNEKNLLIIFRIWAWK